MLSEVQVSLPAPHRGEVLVEVRASGMNPADWKHFAPGGDPELLPLTLGFEAAGVILAIGPETQIASGGGEVGEDVIVFQVADGYSTALLAHAADVFAKPLTLSFSQAANLMLVGTTAAELLSVAGVGAEDTILVHGAAGAVGTSVVQQARVIGATVVGTASPVDFSQVESFGAHALAYGDGLEDRIREAAPQGIDAAVDTVGVDEAVDVSLRVVADRGRIVTTAAFVRAREEGFRLVGAANPSSAGFRRQARGSILTLATAGQLQVPIAAEYPFDDAPRALADLRAPHRSGKFALIV